MKKRSELSVLLFCLVILTSLPAFSDQQDKPLTMAEASKFTATSRYTDVMDFVRELQRRSLRLRVETLGMSAEGRKIPLLVIGNPVPSSPQDLV